MSETLRLLTGLWRDMQPIFLKSTPELYAQMTVDHIFRVLSQRNPTYHQLRRLRTQTKKWHPEQLRALVESTIREERAKLQRATAAQRRQASAGSVDFRSLDTILSGHAVSFLASKQSTEK